MLRRLRIVKEIYRTGGFVSVLRAVLKYLQSDALSSERELIQSPLMNVSEAELTANAEVILRSAGGGSISSITWFLPYSHAQAMGGRTTIYRFARFLRKKNIQNRFAVLGDESTTLEQAIRMLHNHIPDANENTVSVVRNVNDIRQLQATDAGIATKWNTAYVLLRFNQTKQKFYFVQDFEPSFYPADIRYAIAEATYRFGFGGIISTPGLEEEYAEYSSRHMSFVPAVDETVYYPSEKKSNFPLRIVFYGRPSVPRNGFSLGIEALKEVKKRYQDKIEIITAGEDWKPSQYGLEGVLENLGLLTSLQNVADLYRGADIGLGIIFTKHTSYQPFEYMASGTAVVMNRNRFATWFLKDGTNCLLAEPTASDIASKISHLIDDPSLRSALQENGVKSIQGTTWDVQFDRAWHFMRGELSSNT